MKQLFRRLDALTPVGPLVLRVILDGLFVVHGIDKLDTGISDIGGASPPRARPRRCAGGAPVTGARRAPQATAPAILRAMIASSSRPSSRRMSSPCSLKSGARPGGLGTSSNCTGVVTSLNGVPSLVAVSPT